jgi:hypothetical protein
MIVARANDTDPNHDPFEKSPYPDTIIYIAGSTEFDNELVYKLDMIINGGTIMIPVAEFNNGDLSEYDINRISYDDDGNGMCNFGSWTDGLEVSDFFSDDYTETYIFEYDYEGTEVKPSEMYGTQLRVDFIVGGYVQLQAIFY